ncbi:TetR/AcrR family transcriptional regulator [Flavihumibacter petaseus]|uniref:Putative TetR family transcriptional regulator n=1 Tax=Flavihumibacter petaseus NBRC 106054 TaxID=1220578 RepID=A0A0E9N6R1_9BACT|nr:TetR/AcrR family transcriptional regulator [Flavihumibacter petaseus]GAO45488.1 putative TetR family transcriptional regulator [Flavihumibacter petaseus NBRC 106054]
MMSKKEVNKEKIGKAAMKCFMKFGLDKTTLDDIAQSVGLNKASLYYYYKNKEDIFVEAALKEGEDYLVSLQQKVLAKKGVESQVSFYMESRFNYYKNVLNMNSVSVETLNKILPRFFELYEALMKREKQFLSLLIKKAIDEGELEKTNTEKIASVLINISDALKHSVEQQAILKMESEIDYSNSLKDMKFLISLMFNGLKK